MGSSSKISTTLLTLVAACYILAVSNANVCGIDALSRLVGGALVEMDPAATDCGDDNSFKTDQPLTKFLCYSNAMCAPDISLPSTSDSDDVWNMYTTDSMEAAPPNCGVSSNVNTWETDHGWFPSAILIAENAEDVATAVEFAVAQSFSLSIISTGHDFYGGRNAAPNSLQLDLRNLNHVVVDKTSETISCGTGARFQDLIDAAVAEGFAVHHGWHRSVGPAGWALGGGHGPFAPFLGLGADNLISVQLVTAHNGTVTVSADSHPDLFWALRGGGPATFGPVVEMTFKLHPQPSRMDHLMLGWVDVSRSDATALLTAVHSIQLDYHDSWSILYTMPNVAEGSPQIWLVMYHWGSSGPSLAQVRSELTSVVGGAIVGAELEDATYEEIEKYDTSTSTQFPEPGIRAVAGTLVSPAGLASSELVDTIVTLMYDHYTGVQFHPCAGASRLQDGSAFPDSALSDKFRAALAWLVFIPPSAVLEYIPTLDGFLGPLTEATSNLRTAAGGGVYMNEMYAGVYMPGSLEMEQWNTDGDQLSWQGDFWGWEKYAILEETKRRWDPLNVFACWDCPTSPDAPTAYEGKDVDECACGTHNCTQECINTDGGFGCACVPGYALNADGFDCDDVDECVAADHGCDQECVNNDGGFVCDCVPGYRLGSDGASCIDIDECAENNGMECMQICVNTEGGYYCNDAHDDGSAGGDDGGVIDECLGAHSCAQECIDTDDSYMCACREGFRLNIDGFSCDDIDECAERNGMECAEMCVNTEGGYYCDTACVPCNTEGAPIDPIAPPRDLLEGEKPPHLRRWPTKRRLMFGGVPPWVCCG